MGGESNELLYSMKEKLKKIIRAIKEDLKDNQMSWHNHCLSLVMHKNSVQQIAILISATVLQLDIFMLCNQQWRHVQSHWSEERS